VRRTLRHTDALLSLPVVQRAATLEAAPLGELVEIFEHSFPSILVNILLDLRKAEVKRILELVADERRRAVAETATLYYYREYLTNPLPLRIDAGAGISLPNYYAILGVPRDATEDELREAHRLLSRAHAEEFFAPDMRPAATERRTEIDDAYANLRTPEKRAKADRLLPNVSYLYPRRDQAWLEAVHRLIG
jgi:hypothetical protein